MQQYKLSKLSNDSTIFKFVTNKWVKVNDLSVVNIQKSYGAIVMQMLL